MKVGHHGSSNTKIVRWKYELVEEQRPGIYLPVFEDNRGLYWFNSKELALFPYVKGLMKAGINSFKIEGRMKTIHYLASVISFYRRIMDGEEFTEEQGFEILTKVKHRGYSYGFMKGEINEQDYELTGRGSISDAVFVGNIIEEKMDGFSVLEVRNKIFQGDNPEILMPDGTMKNITMPTPLLKKDHTTATYANHCEFLLLKEDFKAFTIFRRLESHSVLKNS